ncbi:MAG: DUF3489 domain-containing protein [Alphaproteobacteria bacterium]
MTTQAKNETKASTETTNPTPELSKTGKTALMSVMLSRPEGANLKEMADALKWKENSVRGAMSTLVKLLPEKELISEKKDNTRYYFLKEKPKSE